MMRVYKRFKSKNKIFKKASDTLAIIKLPNYQLKTGIFLILVALVALVAFFSNNYKRQVQAQHKNLVRNHEYINKTLLPRISTYHPANFQRDLKLSEILFEYHDIDSSGLGESEKLKAQFPDTWKHSQSIRLDILEKDIAIAHKKSEHSINILEHVSNAQNQIRGKVPDKNVKSIIINLDKVLIDELNSGSIKSKAFKNINDSLMAEIEHWEVFKNDKRWLDRSDQFLNEYKVEVWRLHLDTLKNLAVELEANRGRLHALLTASGQPLD